MVMCAMHESTPSDTDKGKFAAAKRKRWVLIGVSVVAIAYPGAWLMVRQSDAFALAASFVRSSPRIVGTVGAVHEVSLSPFGYSLNYVGPLGDAFSELSVKGERGSAIAFVELEKRGVWEVKFARLVRTGQEAIQLAP